MSYVNADMDSIERLARQLTEYKTDIEGLHKVVHERLEELNKDGKWADDKYQRFVDSHMTSLDDGLSSVYKSIDSHYDYIIDYYEKLKHYQESW